MKVCYNVCPDIVHFYKIGFTAMGALWNMIRLRYVLDLKEYTRFKNLFQCIFHPMNQSKSLYIERIKDTRVNNISSVIPRK